MFSSSMLIFGGAVNAQDLQPLRVNEQTIEYKGQAVIQKTGLLLSTAEEIHNLETKKQTLLEQLDGEKRIISELSDKLTAKKAAAEAEKKRLEEIKNMFVHVTLFSADSFGNLYTPGNCTWWAKSKRPDLPNNLGNANTWYGRAQAQGWNVGFTPKKGAVATTTAGWAGHVAYVEGVSVDGQYVTISEMNREGLYVVSYRTVYYTEFQYIYELE